MRGRASACGVGGKSIEAYRRRRNIEDLIADGDADTRRLPRRRAKHAEWKILDRKIADWRIGGFDETSPRRIVGLVERNCHVDMTPGYEETLPL